MKKAIALVLALLVAATLFAGCTQSDPQSSVTPPASAQPSDKPTNSQTPEPEDDGKRDVGNGLMLPLVDERTVLTMWRPMMSNVATLHTSMNGVISNVEKEKRTGIVIEFDHPAVGTEAETLSLLIASQVFPDMIGGMDKSTVYIGGPDKAIEDGVFLRLNEYIDEYAPNFATYLENSDIYKRIVTDGGNIPYTVTIQSDLDGEVQPPWIGPMMRLDYSRSAGRRTGINSIIRGN